MAGAKRRRRKRRDMLIPELIVLVAAVLVIFEGRLVVTMITHGASEKNTAAVGSANAAADQQGTIAEADSEDEMGQMLASLTGKSGSVLAGLPVRQSNAVPVSAQTSGEETDAVQSSGASHATVSNPGSTVIVPEASAPVDDSYFSDAAFIGDSRMQGFANTSGITQGTFFTSVGMSLSTMTNGKIIQTPQGMYTVAAALSGGQYGKVYIMLGTNDLGEYSWESFEEGFISCVGRFQELQPNAIIYICSVIYVDESKVPDSTYVNNKNVDKINSVLLDVCEQEGYHYLDLNEILSDGKGPLLSGASEDGVHVYAKYCQQMLEYMKNHYVTDSGVQDKKI